MAWKSFQAKAHGININKRIYEEFSETMIEEFKSEEFLSTLNKMNQLIGEWCNTIQGKENELPELILDIKSSFKNIRNSLKYLEGYENELYDFENMSDMVFYILDLKKISKYNAFFIKKLFNSFYILIKSKNDLSNEEYYKFHKEFISDLINYEEVFFTKIYSPSKQHNTEVTSKITNSLLN